MWRRFLHHPFAILACGVSAVSLTAAAWCVAAPNDPAGPPATSQPAFPAVPIAPKLDEFPSLLAALGGRDPTGRQQAREALMLLTRDDLPDLRAAASALKLSRLQRALLHEVVVQVYLTSLHSFDGLGPPRMGISSKGFEQSPTTMTVMDRAPGWDSVRVLRQGDQIVGVGLVDDVGKPLPVESVAGFGSIADILKLAHVGDWVTVRLLRDGATLEQRIHLGPTPREAGIGDDWRIEYADGEQYWSETFAPALDGGAEAATRPATRPVRPL